MRDGGVAETAQFAGTTTKGPSYHFSRSPFARASRSISSASSSSRNMSGRSARSGNTLSKLSVPSAKAQGYQSLGVAAGRHYDGFDAAAAPVRRRRWGSSSAGSEAVQLWLRSCLPKARRSKMKV